MIETFVPGKVTIDDLAIIVSKGFTSMEKRFDTLDKKFDAVQATVYRNHENRIRKLETKCA